MTKEDLEKEAKNWCKSKNLTLSNVGYFTADYCEKSYIAVQSLEKDRYPN